MTEFLHNQWYCAMYSALLPEGTVQARTILEEDIVLWRGTDGIVHALEDRCPHRWVPLSLGRQVGVDRIQCKYHGLEFNGAGQCVKNPHGKGTIPASHAPKTYPVHEYCGMIWLWMGWENPDLSLIPDLSPFLPTSPYRVLTPGWTSVANPFDLMIDNVLDTSHVALVHDGILGSEEAFIGQTSFEQKEDAVFARRTMHSIPLPKYYELLYGKEHAKIDIWNNTAWTAPTHLMLDIGCTRPGGTREEGTGIKAQHILTPMTKESCMYHFLGVYINPIERSQAEEEEFKTKFNELRAFVFSQQDGPIIEAQLKVIRKKGFFRPMALPGIDIAAVTWRRIYEKMVADESRRREEHPGARVPLQGLK